MSYCLEHPVSTGRICAPFGAFQIVDGEIEVDEYDVAAALVEEYAATWPDGDDPHPEREPEPVDPDPEPEPAPFDPKTDEPRSATRREICETYEMLVAEGFAEEAEAIRYPNLFDDEIPQGGSEQHKIARRLAKRYLPGWRPPGRLRW